MSTEIPFEKVPWPNLPVVPHLRDIVSRLKECKKLVLTAETGAGKSTVVPLAVQSLIGGNVIMLEPRRAAALAVAARIAALLGEQPGKTAGYSVRHDTKCSAATRITVLTEALLARRMISDPFLDGVSAVILDEFHERSIHGDTALTFLLDIKEARPDLCILIMSATVNSGRIASFLSCPVISVPGRCFPVAVSYQPVETKNGAPPYEPWADICAAEFGAVKDGGSLLMFLPGMKEIQNVAANLEKRGISRRDIQILHGSLPPGEQQAVLAPARGGQRIILASAVAETSVTVPDVVTVIDSGLSRLNRFSPSVGMNRLVTERVTAASAQQRAGRAGRVKPGRCVRLWPEHERLLEETVPEILRSDVTSLVLLCAQRGITDFDVLMWLDKPPAGAWNQARDVLRLLGAVNDAGTVTGKGLALLNLPCAVRIGAVALADRNRGAEYAALLDSSVRHDRTGGNLLERLPAPAPVATATATVAATADEKRLAADIRRAAAGWTGYSAQPLSPPRICAAGFPDCLAKKETCGSYLLYSGRHARLAAGKGESLPDFLLCIDADAGTTEARIYSYVPLTAAEAAGVMDGSITGENVLVPDEKGGFKMRRRHMYGAIMLDDNPAPCDPAALSAAYIQLIRKKGIGALPWNDTSRRLLARLRFYARNTSGVPGFDDSTLLAHLDCWLAPFVAANSRCPCSEQALTEALRNYAGYQVLAKLDTAVPEYITVPSGNRKRLVYEQGDIPILAVKVQEMFGCSETPCVMGVQVLLHLLSPSQRPLQITRDLHSFWNTAWHETVKEMRGRYPKHPWPDNPFEVPPTAGTKKQTGHAK